MLIWSFFAATLHHPRWTLAALALLVVALGAFAGRVELDASADSLVLEQDADLAYYRSMRARYGGDDFLIVTYRPRGALFEKPALDRLAALRDELARLARVSAVTSLLDVPLLEGQSFADARQDARTLRSAKVSLEAARRELTASPLYRNVLVSADGRMAGLHVALERGTKADERLHRDVAAIREVLARYRDRAEIHLAGVPMIVSDMIRFIRHDLRVFGAGVLGFVVVLLAVAFRRPRWVVLPLLVCAAAGVGMLGAIGLAGKPLTVVSSNFLPVLLILTLSLVVHLIVRYEELRALRPGGDRLEAIAQTLRDKFTPCLYTALTTVVAFGSLTLSGIRPVIDFGWLMVAGIAFSFVLAFTAFPALLALLPAADPASRRRDPAAAATGFLQRLVHRRAAPTLAVAALLFVAGGAGIAQLSVENRFIDYFRESTEIHQGMLAIDRHLGGTTPLEVILDADPAHQAAQGSGAASAGLSGTSYWFNMFRLDQVRQVHDYLDGLPETGKVLSLATTMRLLEQLNQGRPLDNFTLAIVHRRLPADLKSRLFEPYLSDDGNQLRFSVRVYESNPALDRSALLARIRTDLVQRFGLEPAQVHLTGMSVLYNNVLESLFRSQVLTFGIVLLAVFLMFLALFRSLRVAAIALVPNLLVAALVLGLMGALGIPLDMMTLTIAAIATGIAVDDTIHYVHRFREEVAQDGDEWAAARRCHRSIGRAIFYTSLTIALGFSVLALSEFVPSVTFGLLTGTAMAAALVADLTVLPALFAVFRPFAGAGAAAP
jgi:predicted RND superfamily exporter protein